MRNVLLLNLVGLIVIGASSAQAVGINRFKSRQVSTALNLKPIYKAQNLSAPVAEVVTEKSAVSVSNAKNDNQSPSVNSSVVDVEGNRLQQYIMRGRGPSYRGTQASVTQDQVLSIKVDFGYDQFTRSLFNPQSNAAFRYQTHIYRVNSLEAKEELKDYSEYVTQEIRTFGHFSTQARTALNTVVHRLYKPNQYTVYVSTEPGVLRNDSTCIYAGPYGAVDFNFQQRVPQAASSGDCADVRENKVWYVNVKLNHCDYTAVFKNAAGQYVREERSDLECAAEFTLYQDTLYYN